MRNDLLKDFAYSFVTGNTFFGYGGRKDDLRDGLFRFEELEENQITSVDKLDFKKNNSKFYDCVILELPFGVSNSRNSKKDIITYFISHLNKNGLLFVGLTQLELKIFEKEGIIPYGLLEGGHFTFRFSPSIKPIVGIFKKELTSKDLFVASFDKNIIFNIELMKKHFDEHTSGKDLSEGFFIDRKEFQSIYNLKIREEIRNLNSEYKDFEMRKLKDLGDITYVDITNDEENCIYIPSIGTMNVVSSIFDLDIKRISKNPQSYFKVKLKTDKVKKEYLVNYFKSELAQLSLKGCFSGFIPRITKTNLGLLEIPVIGINMQEKVIEAYNKLQTWKDYIFTVENNLSTSPKSVDNILGNLNGFEESLKGISEEGKILNLIRQGEGLRLEFKKTFSKPVPDESKCTTKREKSKKETTVNDIRKSTLKNIAGFMNNDGGTVLIGVADDGSIFGIENDFYENDDQYLLNFKDVVRNAFTTENVLYVISYNIVKVGGKKVLRVDCPPSKEMIYLKEENIDGAYVRANPSAEKIKGPDLVKYAFKREKDYENKEKNLGLLE